MQYINTINILATAIHSVISGVLSYNGFVKWHLPIHIY